MASNLTATRAFEAGFDYDMVKPVAIPKLFLMLAKVGKGQRRHGPWLHVFHVDSAPMHSAAAVPPRINREHCSFTIVRNSQ
jgi:hypothetical protein